MMARVYDRLAKEALMQALRAVSRDLIPERELASDAQRLDLWCEPDQDKLAALAPFGLLQRMARQGPDTNDIYDAWHKRSVPRAVPRGAPKGKFER